ncbi:MAG: FAD-dependent monooxygenase [Planctomycetota bacterium]|jgi:flavin-dependent dehydrogenase
MARQGSDDGLQQTRDSLPDEIWDAVVVGAGPAGAVCALHLAGKGHRTLLLDMKRFPREKVCGDGLIPDSIRCLRNAGLYEAVRAEAYETGLATVFSPSRVGIDIPGQYFTLRRERLDEMVARKAVESGATFGEGEAIGLRTEPDGAVEVRLKGSDRAVRGRVAVIATGASVALAGDAGFQTRTRPSAVAVRCYVRSSYGIDRLVGAYDRSIAPGYGWIFPMGGGVYNAGCILFLEDGRPARTNLVGVLDTFLSEFPIAREMMRGGERMTPVRGAMERCGLTGMQPLVKGNVL